MADVECTAHEGDSRGDRPNMLMHPPCACPACAPAPIEQVRHRWLLTDGSARHRRVADAELGTKGSAILG